MKKTLPQNASHIAPASARVQVTAPIQLTPNINVKLETYPDKGRIRLNLGMNIGMQCKKPPFETPLAYIEERNITEEFNKIEREYQLTVQKFSQERSSCYCSRPMMQGADTYNNDHYIWLQFGVIFPNTEAFNEQRTISDMTEMICAMLKARQQIETLLR